MASSSSSSSSRHLEEAVKTLQDMALIMDPEEDYLNILTAEDCVQKTQARRQKEIDKLQTSLKAITKSLEVARLSSTRPSNVPSAEQHAIKMNELDELSLSLVKAISDAEGLLASKESELSMLKEQVRQLKDNDPVEEHERQLDGTALRLRMFKDMGFEPCLDKNGKLVRMIVRSQSGDIHTVDFNDKESDVQRCQRLWKLAAS